MFVRPIENIVTPIVTEGAKNMKFVSAYELMPKMAKPIEVVADRFMAQERTLVEAPKNVLESITRVFW